MELTPTGLYLSAMTLGTVASEIAWRATRSSVGTGRETPSLQVLVAMAAIAAGPLLIAAASSMTTFETIQRSTWADVLTACLVGELWLGVWTFARLTSGKLQRLLQASAIVLNVMVGMAAVLFCLAQLTATTASVAFATGLAALCVVIAVNRARAIGSAGDK
jgi:hypothetical protein